MSYTHDASTRTAHEEIHGLQEQISESRREFFKQVGQGAVATAVATTALHMGVAPYMKPVVSNAAADAVAPEGGWKNLFSIKPNWMYMNIGTTGSTPTAILDRYYDWYYQVARDLTAYATTNDQVLDIVNAGGSYGANPSEFMMSFTTTDGMMKMMQGQDWKAGDKLMITNMEHGGGLGPMHSVCGLHDVAVPTIEVKYVDRLTGADSTEGAANAIAVGTQKELIMFPTGIRMNNTEKLGYPRPHQLPAGEHADDFIFRTQYLGQMKRCIKDLGGVVAGMMISSPPYLTGIRMPEKQICAYTAAKRIRSTIDGAHITGMLNENFHTWGVDFFAGSGHKWQCGPGQTGVAYIRNGKTGDEAWAFRSGAYQTGQVNTGTATAYSNGTALPKYWPWNDSFRMSKYTDAAGTQRRQFVNGYRDPKQNASQQLMSIGNNSVPLNRSLYECNMLWTKIGRANIHNYVVTLAQRFRQYMASEGNTGGVYAFGTEFRKEYAVDTSGKPAWNEVWRPAVDGSRVPCYVACGLTPWNPMWFSGDGYGGADYNTSMSPAMRTTQNSRSSAILTYLNNYHGLYTRNTNAPHQIRFPKPAGSVGTDRVNTDIIYSALANADYGGAANSSQPFRVSTHLFHDIKDVENAVEIFRDDADLRDMMYLGAAG